MFDKLTEATQKALAGELEIKKENINYVKNEQGFCPMCGKELSDYTNTDFASGMGNDIYYAWHCDNCGADGKEWYYMNYSETRTDDDKISEDIGICPECKSENIEYGSTNLDGNSVGYEFECNDCGCSGTEWYDLDFDSHTVDGHEGDTINVINESKKEEAIETKDTSKYTTASDNEEERAYYGKGMTKRNKIRSLDQAKRNLDRAEKDDRVVANQVYDQVSYEDLPSADFDAYKYNKELAKKNKEKGNEFWEKEHNDTAKHFADNIRAKYNANKIKKTEDVDDEVENEDEEEDIDLDTTVSLLDIALNEIPKIGIEDWGKDDELKFVADTKVLFDNLKEYEVEIPEYFYKSASYDDWSNGIDEFLETILGIDTDSGDSDNTYNWNAPLTHDVEFTIYETSDGTFFKGSIHRDGDVRGNYTTEFLLKFDSKDACMEIIWDTCNQNCNNDVTIDGKTYVIEPNFFAETVSIFNYEDNFELDDIYCTCIEELKEKLAENTEE